MQEGKELQIQAEVENLSSFSPLVYTPLGTAQHLLAWSQ